MKKRIYNHLDGKHDKRYAIALEYAGQAKRAYVARFCGQFIGASLLQSEAVAIAQEHYDNHKIDAAIRQ